MSAATHELPLTNRPGWGHPDILRHAGLLVSIELLLAFFVVAMFRYAGPGARWIAVAVLLAIASAVAWAVAPALRAKLARRARLIVEGGELVVDDPAVMRRPLRVPGDAVRVVVPDSTAGVIDQAGLVGRFPIWRFAAPTILDQPFAEMTGYLYASHAGSVVPSLGRRGERPNLALIFERPVALPPLRRMSSAAFVGYPPHGAAPAGAEVPGLLVRVDDPETAAASLGEWFPVRDLSDHDVRDLKPVAPIVRRIKLKGAYFLACAGVLVLYRVLILAHFLGSGH